MSRILVIGANGQIGTELTAVLARTYGETNVIAADVAAPKHPHCTPFTRLDVLDRERLKKIVERQSITDIYLLAALLSVRGEAAPLATWTLNVTGLLNVLELAREKRIARVFWPSSIAAFGPHSPRQATPQWAVMDPITIYGASKQAGERLCEYYFARFAVDVRSIRFPGVISYRTPPGGGTTDYAVAIFHAAKRGQPYRCFLAGDTTLPMIYVSDAVRAAIELMHADAARLSIRSSYNVAGLSFSPCEIAAAIRRHRPDFEVTYVPDFRQSIAATWPATINDDQAREDWNWRPRVDLNGLTERMLENIPLDWQATA